MYPRPRCHLETSKYVSVVDVSTYYIGDWIRTDLQTKHCHLSGRSTTLPWTHGCQDGPKFADWRILQQRHRTPMESLSYNLNIVADRSEVALKRTSSLVVLAVKLGFLSRIC